MSESIDNSITTIVDTVNKVLDIYETDKSHLNIERQGDRNVIVILPYNDEFSLDCYQKLFSAYINIKYLAKHGLIEDLSIAKTITQKINITRGTSYKEINISGGIRKVGDVDNFNCFYINIYISE